MHKYMKYKWPWPLDMPHPPHVYCVSVHGPEAGKRRLMPHCASTNYSGTSHIKRTLRGATTHYITDNRYGTD